MQEKLTKLCARAASLAAAIAAIPAAQAISLGEIEVRSALGEPFDAAIPLVLAPGETVDAACFALARDDEPGIPVVTGGLFTVDRAAERSVLRVRSSSGIYEPAIRARVRAGCPSQMGETMREYTVLLEPRRGEPVAAPTLAALPATAGTFPAAESAPAAPPAPAAGAAPLRARDGDTLQGLATRIFARNRVARDLYMQAMREANPALASLGPDDAIPAGAPVALPELRRFSRTVPTPAPAPAPAPGIASAAPHKTPHAASARKTDVQPGPVPQEPGATPGYVLRLSGGEMDLSRAQKVDAQTRNQLRERLVILDSDDQVSAMLALRNRLSELEARVNELQLKLTQMPASFPARPANDVTAPTPPVAEAPNPETPKPEAPKPEAPKPEAQKTETPKPEAATPAPGTPKAPAAAAQPASPEAAPSASAAEASQPDSPKTDAVAQDAAAAAAKPAPAKAAPFDFARLWQSYGFWAGFIVVLGLLVALAWRLSRRREAPYEVQDWDAPPPDTEAPVDTDALELERAEGGTYGRALALPAADAGALRQRYIEERFPEVLTGALMLDDPASVVKAARLFYEDGAMPRAVELLQFAIEHDPTQVRPWLALFEIYRVERLSGEFAELARRFYEQFGDTEYWRKVRYFGREIDPGDLLYREDVDALETIAPGTRPRVGGERFDAARENWLAAPMDFENDVLANELRQALMANAGVVDQDLVPNPLPALRDAEMFTVA